MAWIKSNQELAQHPKLKRLMRALGISAPDAIGRLHLLWWWVMNYAQDGDLSNFEPEDIADAMMWDGDPQRLVDALVECGGNKYGFLEFSEDGGLRIHDWMEHGGKYLENQQKDAERKRQSRQKDVQRTSGGQVEDVQWTSDVRKEEKRKEENRKDTTPPTPPSQGGVRAGGEYSPAFELFWSAYPRKVQKQTAFKAWLGVVRHGTKPEDLTQAAAAYHTAGLKHGTPPDKILHPATFLHEDRWKDWLPPDGASYRESLVIPMRGRDSPGNADIPKSYEEAVAKYRHGGAIDVEVTENDTRAGLQAVC